MVESTPTRQRRATLRRARGEQVNLSKPDVTGVTSIKYGKNAPAPSIYLQSLLSHCLVGIICLYVGLLMGTKNSRMIAAVNEAVYPLQQQEENVKSASTYHQEHPTVTSHNSLSSIISQLSSTAKTPFPETLSRMFVDYATIPRDQFNNMLEIGVPLDATKPDAEEVLVLYTSVDSTPNITKTISKDHRFGIDAEKALENCHTVKVILQEANNRRRTNQCIAIVPQWEDYTVHKFMRIPESGTKLSQKQDVVDLQYPLQYVARSHRENGLVPGVPSQTVHTKTHYKLLVEYLQNYDRMIEDLKPILADIIKHSKNPKSRSLIVLTCNKGQSVLFRNFICNAKAKGLDLSHVIMFATDEYTLNLSRDLGIPAWYDESIFGDMPEEAASKYGDMKFSRMMMAKVYCVHLAVTSGYNVLFHDVDVIWNRNPLPYLESKEWGKWDMLFQDDGSRQPRFAPYSPNTGFYFVRNNAKTQFFFGMLLRMGDVMQRSKSHQSVLNDLIQHFASWKGLRVKTFPKDGLFPGGAEFHNNKSYMRELVLEKSKEYYIFHMSWTENKENKKKFLEQLGEWYTVEDTDDVLCSGIDCCLSTPNITCHYNDKPSKIPCNFSPSIDKNREPFW